MRKNASGVGVAVETGARRAPGPLLDIYELAARTRLSVPTLRRALRERRLGYVRLGRRVFVRETELNRWLAAAEVPARERDHGRTS